MPKPTPQCRACGNTDLPLFSLYGQLYRHAATPNAFKALPKVTVCKPCIEAFIGNRVDSRTVEMVHAIAASVKATYKAIEGGTH